MKGILFKPDMIKAIVEGRKTQTRRVMPNQPVLMDKVYEKDFRKDFGLRKPRYQVGETVYIKEAYWQDQSGGLWDYKLDSSRWQNIEWPVTICGGKAVSPLFMPQWATRYFIKITDVRAERLQEITEAGIESEGCGHIEASVGLRIQWYKELWDSINKAYPWESNPWVWVYTFTFNRSGE